MQGLTVEYGVVQSQNGMVIALEVVAIGGMTCVCGLEKKDGIQRLESTLRQLSLSKGK